MKRERRTHSGEFKQEAVALVVEQGYSCAEAGRSLGVNGDQGRNRTIDTRIFSLIVLALRLLFSIGYQDARCSICITVRDGAQLIHAMLTHRVRR